MISRLETVCSKSRRKKSDSDIISSYLSLYLYIYTQLILKHLYNNKVSFIYIYNIFILLDIYIYNKIINIFIYYYY